MDRILTAKHYWLTIDLIIKNQWEEVKDQFTLFLDKKSGKHHDFYYNILNTLFNIYDGLIINKHEEIDRLLLIVKNKKIRLYLED